MDQATDRWLGGLQRQVLVWLYQQTLQARAWASALPEKAVDRSGNEWHPREFHLQQVEVWGIPWQAFPHDMRSPRGKQAALSKALRRLEERGFVLRANQRAGGPMRGVPRARADEPHSRTTHVRLTEAGKRVANELTNEPVSL